MAQDFERDERLWDFSHEEFEASRNSVDVVPTIIIHANLFTYIQGGF